LKIRWRGELKVSPKSLGVKAFSTKLPGGSLFWVLLVFNMFLENLPGRGAVAVKLIEVSRLRFKTASTWGGN
jgi:hypothetical protein